MFNISRCTNRLGAVVVQRRWIAGVSKETMFDIINNAKSLKQLQILKNDERVHTYVGEALRNPTQETVHELMQVKRKMLRSLGKDYFLAVNYIEQSIPVDVDKLKFRTEFQKQVTPYQYDMFVKTLSHLRTKKGYDRPTRRKELYKAIELHRWCNPKITKESGILLPEDIHKWFYMFVPKEDRLSHYNFLIENNVVIAGDSAERFQSLMLTGSQLEYQVATFQHFIRDPTKRHLFEEKFIIMHAFKPIKNVVDTLIENNDIEHIKEYFDALITRLEHIELKNEKIPYVIRKSYFNQFMLSLLCFARHTYSVEMFLQVTQEFLNSLPKNTPVTFIQKPLAEIISHFQKNQDTETVFKLMSLFDKFALTKPNSKFTNEMLGRIVHSLRSFNDPKLTMSYILSTYCDEKTRIRLNSLGLWCLIFDNKFGHLPLQAIKHPEMRKKYITVNVPKRLKYKGTPDTAILNELYIVVFDYYKKKLSKEEYKELVLKCFSAYCHYLKKDLPDNERWKIDTSILRTMIHRAKYDLRDNRLAFDMLIKFYSLNLKPRFDSKSAPFGLVLYGNDSISQEEFNQVLKLMQECNAPMDSKLFITIILRFLKSDDIHSAHEWYNRFLKVGFHLKHFTLIEEAKRLEWTVPETAEKYYQECEEKNKLEENESFDDIYLQSPVEDSYTEEILKIAEKLGEFVNVSENKREEPSKTIIEDC